MLRTGITPDQWVAMGDRTIVTALELLELADKPQRAPDAEGRQMSG